MTVRRKPLASPPLSRTIRCLSIGLLFLLIPFTGKAAIATEDEKSEWTAQVGDHVMVDTDASIIYLVHTDGTSLALDGLTGQRRNVYYLGLYYFAGTPEAEWQVTSVEKKGRSTTFGEGRFLRLFKVKGDDTERTAYGFHSHRQFQQMLDDKHEKNAYDTEGMGHRSYGCILLSEDDLSLVVAALDVNGGSLTIHSGPGLAPPPVEEVSGSIVPSWLGW